MRQVNCWRDLEQFGICALTGEACSHAMRLLCDVTADGKRIVESFLGGRVEIAEGSNWNSRCSSGDHVGSVLLPRSILTDLGAFCLLETRELNSMIVGLKGGGVNEYNSKDLSYYLDYGDSIQAGFSKWHREEIQRYYCRPDESSSGRNEHAASGRVC